MNNPSFIEEGIGVSQFVELVNQTFDMVIPTIKIVGELANFRVSQGKWVYFDLKDETSCLKFFGTVFQLKTLVEDGMMLKISCRPNLHKNYGFSMQIQSIELMGEGSIRRAAEILQLKLAKEGLFDVGKKRSLPYPPTQIGLITSSQSAAYHDFIKIINNRWRGLTINLANVQVQGEVSIDQIISAIKYFNDRVPKVEVIILIRGGGSPEDLAVFSSETITRAVAASKIPTLVAIGHEIDVSLAELAADRRASTPSHAAELLVPERRMILSNLKASRQNLDRISRQSFNNAGADLALKEKELKVLSVDKIAGYLTTLGYKKQLVAAHNPDQILRRGFSIVRRNNQLIRRKSQLSMSDVLDIRLSEGNIKAKVKELGEN